MLKRCANIPHGVEPSRWPRVRAVPEVRLRVVLVQCRVCLVLVSSDEDHSHLTGPAASRGECALQCNRALDASLLDCCYLVLCRQLGS